MTSPRIRVKTRQLKEISTGSSTTNVAHLIVNLGIQSRRSYLARRCVWIFGVSRTPDWEPLQKLDGKHQLSIARFEMIIPQLSRALSLWQHRRASVSQITKYSMSRPGYLEKTCLFSSTVWEDTCKTKIDLSKKSEGKDHINIFRTTNICA